MPTGMTNQKKSVISIVAHFNALPERVWQAWTDPVMLKLWFGSDTDGKVLNADLNVFEGGCFEVSFVDSDLTEHTCKGIYTTVKINTRLGFTWTWKSEPGFTSFITISITSAPNCTLMNFEHANIDFSSAHNYEIGWRNAFKKLERVLREEKLIGVPE